MSDAVVPAHSENLDKQPANEARNHLLSDLFLPTQIFAPIQQASRESFLVFQNTAENETEPEPDDVETVDDATEPAGKNGEKQHVYRFSDADDQFHSDDKAVRRDTYTSLEELKKGLVEGTDYRTKFEDRNSKITIAAPHGGHIEPGSSELATAIAGNEYNLFDFRGLDPKNPYKAHVTSAHYRDPDLTKLLAQSDVCVSVHGMRGTDKIIYVGGLNSTLKNLVGDKLKAEGFKVDTNPPRFRGIDNKNFVNLPSQRGVQLELSWGIRKEIMGQGTAYGTTPSSKYDSFVDAVRDAIETYEKNQLKKNRPDGSGL